MAEVQEWKLRVRGPKGTPAELVLPAGPSTTIAELRSLAGKATKVAAKRVKLKCGFPPKELVPSDEDATTTVWTAGIFNRDVLMIERADPDSAAGEGGAGGAAEEGAAEEGAAAGGEGAEGAGTGPPGGAPATGAGAGGAEGAAGGAGAGFASPLRPLVVGKGGVLKEKRAPPKRKARMPGQGQRLGGGPDDAGGAAGGDGAEGAADAADAAGGGGAAPKRRRAGKERDIMAEADSLTLGGVKDMEHGARLMLAGDLMAAAAGPASWNPEQRSLLTSLRKSLREKRKEREKESQGEMRYMAAQGGKVEFQNLQDGTGRLQVVYKGDPLARKPTMECVQDIPRPLLAAVLAMVAADEDPVSRANLQPVAMAQVSTRMFWAVVHHAGVGLEKDFRQALMELCPAVDWSFVHITRERWQPERYADFVSH